MIDLSLGGTAFPRALEVREHLYNEGSRGESTRFRRLDRLDAFYKCCEYDHQGVSWDGGRADELETVSANVSMPYGHVSASPGGGKTPVSQKRPTAPYRLTPMVVDRFTGLLFSKDRIPNVVVENDPLADDFWKAVVDRTKFWRTMYQARTYGGSMGSSLVTLHFRSSDRGGRFSFRAHSPKTVHDIAWEDPDLKIPAGVLIQYRFEKEVEELDEKTSRPTGQFRSVPFLYRRIIDQEADIVFKPAQITGNRLPDMEIDENQSYRHNLGQFPGVWIQNLPGFDDELDGLPDCEGLYQLFDTIDRQAAQSNKGLMANQDPTLVISRDRKDELAGVPLQKGSDNALNVGLNGSASYLEIAGSGITASAEFRKELKQTGMDKAQCVLVDPTQISGAAQSAKAIEYIYAPMLEKSARHRQQYGDAISQLVQLTLDMGRRWMDPALYSGNARIYFDLEPKVEEIDLEPESPEAQSGVYRRIIQQVPGEGGKANLTWGPYFAPTPEDRQTEIQMIASAFSSRLIDQETAVRKAAPLLNIEDVEAVLTRLAEEAEVLKAEQEERMSSLFPMGGEVPIPGQELEPPGGPPPGGIEPTPFPME